jgi:hypothetical protein
MAVSGTGRDANAEGTKRADGKVAVSERERKIRRWRERESGNIELRLSCVQPITERRPSGQFARIALDLHSRHRNTTVPPAGAVGVRGKAGDRREEGRAKKESPSAATRVFLFSGTHVAALLNRRPAAPFFFISTPALFLLIGFCLFGDARRC